MTPFRLLAALLLALCLAQPALAAGPATLDATVAGLWMDGALELEGRLAAVASTGHASAADPISALEARSAQDGRAAPTSLRLAAQHLRVETDFQRNWGPPAVALLGGPQSESIDFRDAVASTAPARPHFQFYLAPLPGHAPPAVRLQAVQAHLEPVPDTAPEPERKVSSPVRPPLEGAPGPAMAASGGLRTLRIEGDFVLTLWEWDLEVQGTVLRSGAFYSPTAPSAGSRETVGYTEERQLFAFARGAVLDLALPNDVALALAIQPQAATLDGRLVLDQPQGRLQTLSGAQPLRDGDWVDGSFSAALTDVTASSFHAVLEGTGRQAHLADLTVPIVSPAPSATGALLATLAAGATLLVGGWRLWGRRPRRSLPAPSRMSPLAGGDDEVQALHWLSHAGHADTVLWDSDLMFAFDWSAERAQKALRALQAKGQVRCKAIALAPGRTSLGQIALTAAGADRLRAATGRPATHPHGVPA